MLSFLKSIRNTYFTSETKSDKESELVKLPRDLWRNTVFPFLTGNELIEAEPVSKLFQGLVKHDSIWRERLKNEFDFDPELVKKITNAKLVYQRVCYLRRENPYDFDRWIKHQMRSSKSLFPLFLCQSVLPDSVIKENSFYVHWTGFSYALQVGNIALCRYLTSDARGKNKVIPNVHRFFDAIKSGHEELTQLIVELLPREEINKLQKDNLFLGLVFCHALESGNLSLLEKFVNQYLRREWPFSSEPVRWYRSDWLNEDELPGYYSSKLPFKFRCELFSFAAKHFTALQWLLREDVPKELGGGCPNINVLHIALSTGNIKSVRLLLEEAPKEQRVKLPEWGFSDSLINYIEDRMESSWKKYQNEWQKLYISAAGNVELVKLMVSKCPYEVAPTDECLQAAAKKGDIATMCWWMQEAPPAMRLTPNIATMNAAAGGGQLAVMKFLSDPPKPFASFQVKFDQSTLNIAAKDGTRATVKYLVKEAPIDLRVMPNLNTLIAAASVSNLRMCQWLLDPLGGNLQVDLTPEIIKEIRGKGDDDSRLAADFISENLPTIKCLELMEECKPFVPW